MLLPQLRTAHWRKPQIERAAPAQPDTRLPCVLQLFQAGCLVTLNGLSGPPQTWRAYFLECI